MEVRSFDNYTIFDETDVRRNYGLGNNAQHAVISYIVDGFCLTNPMSTERIRPPARVSGGAVHADADGTTAC
jgi:hypothetical protein